jgi:hypothetical protein
MKEQITNYIAEKIFSIAFIIMTKSEIKANFNVHGDDIRDNFDSSFDFLGLTKNSLQNFVEWSFSNLFGRTLRQKLGV